MPVDSNFLYSGYYAAIAALQLEDRSYAIKALNNAKKYDFNKNEILQSLSEEYKAAEDTVNWEKALHEGLEALPDQHYFLFNLIQNTMFKDQGKALSMINEAIKKDPEKADLYSVAGRVYELNPDDIGKAEENFKKAIQLDSESAENQSNLGRIYFNQAVSQLDKANAISDVKAYNAEKEKVNEQFRKAMPFFEKARIIDSKHRESYIALSSIYYNLNMLDKLEELEKSMNQ